MTDPGSALAQTVSGTVRDAQGQPLAGATVVIEGTSVGTATDVDGRYTIRLPGPGAHTLVVSFVGYVTARREINGEGQQIDFRLEEAPLMLKDVVVTAENRTALAQDVPIAMALLSGEELETTGTTDLLQLQFEAPGLHLVQNTIFNQIGIRGVSSQAGGESELSDQAVTLNIDGEYINRPTSLNAALYDLERVEVLKGPQGTLYGRNATAGAINIITNKPVLRRTEASVSGQYGNYNLVKLTGALNLPLGDVAAIRLAGLLDRHDGYRDGGPAGRIDDGNVMGLRLGLRLDPAATFSLYVAGEYNRTDQQAPSQYGVNVAQAAPSLIGQPPATFSTELPKDFDVATGGFLKIDQYALRGRLRYSFGPAWLTYTGGYRYAELAGYQPLNGFLPETFSFDNNFGINTHSHELRLNGETPRFIWQTGMFYGYENQDVRRGLFLPAAAGAFGGRIPFLNYSIFDVTSSTFGVFGQATYNVTEQLGLTGGLRYTHDEKKRTGQQLGVPPFVPGAPAYFYPDARPQLNDPGMVDRFGEGNWSQVTWMVNADYDFTEDNMAYAKVSTGYKAGGFDELGPYDPEYLTAFEVGSKNRFLDARLRLNGSTFFYAYRDQQVTVFFNTEIGGTTQNAGSTNIFGIELDGEFLATARDRFRFSINFLEAKYHKFPTLVNVVSGDQVSVDLSGNRPVHSPRWILIGGYDRDVPLGPGILNIGVKTQYKSAYYLTPFNFAMERQDAYTKTDVDVAYRHPDGRWEIGAFVHNLEDNRIITYAAFTGGGIDLYNWIFGAPRTYGVRLSYLFR
ncbi:TonB-dependent receptor [Rhodocaloribacter litoris]|uniref:TonB-dependent receptor n=1 Tax=Rhodocaloribacter litoris TaxID=2558931 RepID=UPI001E42905B|nr:TonB-dependent receptor [Rhodocaloribacter litoris]